MNPRCLVLLLVVLVLSLAACDSGGSANDPDPPAESPLTFRTISFALSDGQRVSAEQGKLTVPENRALPNGNTIQLGLVRFKSTASNPGPPIIYLTGGPGGSGVEEAHYLYVELFRDLLAVADVIALDQRGTGSASPNLDCNRFVELPPEVLGSREALIQAFDEPSRACAQFWEGRGVDLQAYNTNENADDVEALRRALAVETISLLGISYGTHLALTFARRHPERLHRMVLAGVEGPNHTLKLPGTLQQQLEQIDQLAQADPAVDAVIPDFLGLLEDLLAQLEAQPVTVQVADPQTGQQVEVVVTKFMLQFLVSQNMGFARDVSTVPALLYPLSQRDYADVAQAILAFRGIPHPSAMTFMMDCSSGASDERLARIDREAEETLLGDVLNLPFPAVCEAWGDPDLGPAFRAPANVEAPTLLVSGTLDGRTPVSNGEEILQGLPNGIHLILENGGHDTIDDWFTIPAYKDAVVTFFSGNPLSITHITLPFSFVIPETN